MPGKISGQNYAEIMGKILDAANGPIPVKEFSQQVLALRPSAAKDPLQAVKNQLKQENGRLLVFLDANTILPMRLAMKGARFRLQLDRSMVENGLLELGNWMNAYLPRSFDLRKVLFVDSGGEPIGAPSKSITKKEKTIFGTYDATSLYADLGGWLRKHKPTRKDFILFTVIDWQNGIFQLDYEPYSKYDPALLSQRNQIMADLFYAMLENASREELLAFEAVASVYARMPDKSGYPADIWTVVLEKDGRMVGTGWDIRYSDDDLSPLAKLERELSGAPRERPKATFPKEQRNQVYCFKAELKHNPKIWRQVEILGNQNLDDLNRILVNAFNHDWDHMGGFWKLVPRKGSGKVRYREVELGDVDPEGGGDGADLKIVEMGLVPGDRLKFVFDFGDWIEHTLSLESVAASQPKMEYPRETARNEPKHVYCVSCREKSQKTVAEWICLTCSDEHQKQMVYCEECLAEHEDHYTEEILY